VGPVSTSEWLDVLHGVGFAAECQALPGEDRRCFVARRRDWTTSLRVLDAAMTESRAI